jgi:hypothetical protein
MSRRALVVLAAAGMASLSLPASGALGAVPAGMHWTVMDTQDPSPQANYLTSTLAITPGDVWAVGAWYRPELSTPGTLTEHWNGSKWRLVPSPNVTDGYNELYSVSGIASDDVWAVGYHNIADYGSERTLAMHWNGRRWSVVKTSNLGTHASELEGVHAFAPDDVWAVGFGDDPGGFVGHAIAEHWNGHRWRLIDLAPMGSGGSELSAVGGSAPDDVWAVGWKDEHTLVEHFDGSSWSVVASPDGSAATSELSAVTSLSPDDAWAVGTSEDETPGKAQSTGDTLVLHWNGKSWRVVPSPDGPRAGNGLLDLAAFAPDDIWAAGFSYDDLGATAETLVEHWNGSTWRVVAAPSPDPDYNEIDGLAGTDARHLWAVGAQGSLTLAMRR